MCTFVIDTKINVYINFYSIEPACANKILKPIKSKLFIKYFELYNQSESSMCFSPQMPVIPRTRSNLLKQKLEKNPSSALIYENCGQMFVTS